ncbi:MAG: FGGY-family carbohydrate kinase [Spirochaetota bacterium]
MKDLILSIDFGTQSVRAILFNPKGEMVAKEKESIEPYYSKKPGWAEQDVLYLWESLCNATKRLKTKAGDRFNDIAGVSLTTQRSTIVTVDKNGNPLRPAIIWMDDRKIWEAPKYKGLERLLHKLVRMDYVADLAQANCEANWIIKNQPEIWEKTYKYLFLSGYLTYKLTGEYRDSIASQIGYVPFDFKNFKWCEGNDFKNYIFPIERDKLPELVKPTDILGEINEKASEDTGIPKGLPLISSGSDKSCETVGVGCLTPEYAALSFGTTATVQTTTDKYTEIVMFNPPYPAVVPDHWNTEFQIYRGFWMIEWFKQEFGDKEIQKAINTGEVPEKLLNKLLNESPAGSMGLISQPYWTPGVKIPGPEGKGSIIGFSDVHKRAHIYRAIIEGLGYALKNGTQMTENRSKTEIKEVRVAGGGSQSDAICQITSDIFDKPVRRGELFEATALGNAMVGMVGMKIHNDFNSANKEMLRLSTGFEPQRRNADLYKEIYYKVYKKMYRKLKPLFKKLKDIFEDYSESTI